jgi:membrane-associated phospholipid phosphatase
MPELSFSVGLVQFLFENRNGLATALFQLFSFIGGIEGYVLVVVFIHVVYEKKLAFRLSVLLLLTMSLNHFLKTLIANPRPFVSNGTYAEKWAVSAAKADELAREYSTPSGHAMAGSCFYTYLAASVKHRYMRSAAIVTLLLTGLSRPYLGVHYFEDVLMGWALGIPIALFALRFVDRIGRTWSKLSFQQQVLMVVASSTAVWFATRRLYESNAHGQPLLFMSYMGFLTGIVFAFPLEAKLVGFDPRSSPALHKMLRYVMSVALVIGTLLLLDWVFGLVASDASPLGSALRFARYAIAGIVGMLLAPFLFVRVGLARTTPPIPERPPPTRRKSPSSPCARMRG